MKTIVKNSFLGKRGLESISKKEKVSHENEPALEEGIEVVDGLSIIDDIESSLSLLDTKMENMRLDFKQAELDLLILEDIYKKTVEEQLKYDQDSLLALNMSEERIHAFLDENNVDNQNLLHNQSSGRYTRETIPIDAVFDDDRMQVEELNTYIAPEDTAEDTKDTPPPEDTPEDTAEDTPPPEDIPEDTAEDTPPPEDTAEKTQAFDDYITIDEDNKAGIDVLINDTDSDSAVSEVSTYTQAENGIVSLEADGTLRYTPNQDYNGIDSFTYINKDGNSATVNITINAIDDKTTVKTDEATTTKDTAIIIDVLANDIDVDEKSAIRTMTQGNNGTVNINADGTVTYTPNAGFTGKDTFRYTNQEDSAAGVSVTVNDVQKSRSIKAVNDSFDIGSETAPVGNDSVLKAMLHTNDTLPENGEYLYSIKTGPSHGELLIYGDGEFEFKPEDYYDGNDSFTYVLEDNAGNQSVATVHLKINSVEKTDSTPIILDLNGDGVQTIAIKDGVQFDIDADGDLDKTAWVSAYDGLLVRDINNDGIINDASELFGEEMLKRDGTKAVDGYDALREYDSNGDGVVNSDDDKFDTIKIFKDSNSDGITDDGDLLSLSEAGVSQLSTATTDADIDNNGNTIGLESSYKDLDGVAQDAADVWFSYEEINFDLVEEIEPMSNEEKISLTLEELFPVSDSENTIQVEVNEDNEVSFNTDIQLEYANNILDDSQSYASSEFLSVNLEVEIVVYEY